LYEGRRGRDHMVIGFTTTMYPCLSPLIMSSNPVHGEVCWIQDYVINFVSDLPQVGGFIHQ